MEPSNMSLESSVLESRPEGRRKHHTGPRRRVETIRDPKAGTQAGR